MAHLFSWRCRGKPVVFSDTPPAVDEPVLELIFHRNATRIKADGVRPHLGHPVHEAALAAPLPSTLQVLRLDGCRVRTWPKYLPLGIHEIYANQCDFFTLPDLTAYTNLIVLDMPDNRMNTLTQPLPPSLARLDFNSNAMHSVLCTKPTTLANAQFRDNPGLDDAIQKHATWRLAVAAAAQAIPAQAPPPPLTIPPVPDWVAATCRAPRVFTRVRGDLDGPRQEARKVNPYENAHNVHDSGIQDSTKANLTYIANYKSDVPPIPNILNAIQSTLEKEERNKGTWACNFMSALRGIVGKEHPVVSELRIRIAQPYVMHGVMPAEIVDRLWLRIMDFPKETRDDVLKRFCDEVLDAAAHCTNGFMVRMANVLIGYDENCVMRMRPTQILQARVPATMERLRKKLALKEGDVEPWTFWRDCVVQTWEDMEEIEMEHGERGAWLGDLIAPLLPELCKGLMKSMRSGQAPMDSGDSDLLAHRIRLAIEAAGLNKKAKDETLVGLSGYVRDAAMDYLNTGGWAPEPPEEEDSLKNEAEMRAVQYREVPTTSDVPASGGYRT